MLVLVLLLTGCGLVRVGVSARARVTAVRVVRTSEFAANHIPPLERTISNPLTVRALFLALLALPPYPMDMRPCPVDYGVTYEISLLNGSRMVLRADAEAGGCEDVPLNFRDDRRADGAFWAVLAQALGMPVGQVYPVVPRPSGPSAPPPTV